jgi:hypothetical protein
MSTLKVKTMLICSSDWSGSQPEVTSPSFGMSEAVGLSREARIVP